MCTGRVCVLMGWDYLVSLDGLVLVVGLEVLDLLRAGPVGIPPRFGPPPRLGAPLKLLPGVEPAKIRPFLRSTRSDPTPGPPKNGLRNRIVPDSNLTKPCGFSGFDFQTPILGEPPAWTLCFHEPEHGKALAGTGGNRSGTFSFPFKFFSLILHRT